MNTGKVKVLGEGMGWASGIGRRVFELQAEESCLIPSGGW